VTWLGEAKKRVWTVRNVSVGFARQELELDERKVTSPDSSLEVILRKLELYKLVALMERKGSPLR